MPLFPPIEPYEKGFLQVDGVHKLYYEVSGNPNGTPILFLHGGPGSKTDPKHREFFDPSRYKIILFDQRGCGQSTPFASIENNTTWDLVEDMEKLRNHLSVEKWVLFGGSWGSTLALTYAITHADKVTKLILRGIFLGTDKEIEWFYQLGARHFYPKQWEAFISFIPEEERGNLLQAYYKRLTSDNQSIVSEAARCWSTWELTCVRLGYDAQLIEEIIRLSNPVAIARIEVYYFIHKCFLPEDNWILNNLFSIKNIPIHIVQGRYDLLCPPETAYRLSQIHENTYLHIVQEGGHSTSDPQMIEALVKATTLT